MSTASAPSRPGIRLAAASLVTGPLLMSIGDLLHPDERMAPAEQVAILVDHASRWYTAHLLLFIGMMLFIPGLLALSALAMARRPAAGRAARVLSLMGMAAFAGIFVAEMLVGRLVLDGAAPAEATQLLTTMFSGPMLAAVGPAMLAFFVGTALFAIPLIREGGGLGRAAAAILLGTLCILGEILSAQVILSQLGNVLILCGCAYIAWLLLRGAPGTAVDPA